MSNTIDIPEEFYQRIEETNFYPFTFRDYLNGDPIQSVAIASTTGPTVTETHTSDTVTVKVVTSGCTGGNDYSVVVKITSTGGVVETRKMIIHCLANHTT